MRRKDKGVCLTMAAFGSGFFGSGGFSSGREDDHDLFSAVRAMQENGRFSSGMNDDDLASILGMHGRRPVPQRRETSPPTESAANLYEVSTQQPLDRLLEVNFRAALTACSVRLRRKIPPSYNRALHHRMLHRT